MESWGCEYLDLEDHENFTSKSKKEYLEIPMNIMARIIDKNVHEMTKKKDGQYIANLREDILKNGLKNPAEITIGPNAIILTDGNHRYCACLELQYETFPVKIKVSDQKLKLAGLKATEIIKELLEQLYAAS